MSAANRKSAAHRIQLKNGTLKKGPRLGKLGNIDRHYGAAPTAKKGKKK